MKFRHTLVAASLATLAFAPAVASADVVQITDIQGFWQLAVPPGPNIDIVNNVPTSIISWGVAAGASRSSYTFTAFPTPPGVSITVNPPPDSGPMQFGTFTHNNFPITCPSSAPCLQSVQLMIQADITVAGQDEGIKTFIANFTHDETNNQQDPCPFSGDPPGTGVPGPNGKGININGCADRVTVTTVTGGDTFDVGGVLYTLSFTGFSQDGGKTLSNTFYTIEDQANIAGLYARVVVAQPPTVPEPGSLALVGLAALGVAGALRRKSKK